MQRVVILPEEDWAMGIGNMLKKFSNSPRAEGHLFAGNDQVFNWYFWKGPTLGYSKQDFLKLGSGGLRFY